MEKLLRHLNVRYSDCDSTEEVWQWVQKLANRDTQLAQEVVRLLERTDNLKQEIANLRKQIATLLEQDTKKKGGAK